MEDAGNKSQGVTDSRPTGEAGTKIDQGSKEPEGHTAVPAQAEGGGPGEKPETGTPGQPEGGQAQEQAAKAGDVSAAAPGENAAGETEKESAPVAENQNTSETPAGTSEASKAEEPEAAQPPKHFPGELSDRFEDVLTRIPRRNRNGFLLLVFFLQPLLGALPHQVKAELANRVDNPTYFSIARATGLNILCNLFAYPLVLMIIAALVKGVGVLFSQNVNVYILTGLVLGLIEGAYRLKEGIFHVEPEEDLVLRGAFYGAPLSGLVRGMLSRHAGLLRQIPVPVEGFYGKGFVEKLERERRYGQAYTLEDLGDAYHLRLEFPRVTPDIGLAGRTNLPREMPDYDYELELRDGFFIVKGRCVDERVRKVTGNVGAFPPGFTTVIPLGERVAGYSHQYEDKTLQVILLKERGASRQAA